MFLSFFFKVAYACIFRDSSGIAFHNFDAAYLHDLKPTIVDFTGVQYCGAPKVISRAPYCRKITQAC